MNIIKKDLPNLRLNYLVACAMLAIQIFCSSLYAQDTTVNRDFYEIRSSESGYISGKIFLKWRTSSENNIYSFQLFREDNLNGEFNKIADSAGVNSVEDSTYLIVIDSLIVPQSTYRYYAVLNSESENQSSVSDTIMIPAYDLSSVLLPQNVVADGLDSLGAIKLQWKLAQPRDILSLKIFRSEKYDSNYVELAEVPNADSIFIDRTAEPMKKYFYYLVMTDPFGNQSFRSAKVFGSYKSKAQPLAPYNIAGEGTNRGVKLQWTKPDDYILSYHIYRNDGIYDSLFLLSTIKSDDSTVTFYDTSRTLQGDIVYNYAILSENTSGSLSLFSDTIYVRPNIAVAIRAPLDFNGYARDSVVQLYWENVFASMPTLDGYVVYRKEPGSAEDFQPLLDSLISAKQNNFIDSTVQFGKSYEYAVQAVDIYKNESPLSSTISITTEPVIVFPPAGIIARRSADGILITWNETIQKNIKAYKIYRYQRGYEAELISSVTPVENSEYLDKNVTAGNLYFYFLKSVDTTDVESLPSKEVGIRF